MTQPGPKPEVKAFAEWLCGVLKEQHVSHARLVLHLNRASDGTNMISRNRVRKDLEAWYLPEWSYVVSNYLGPVEELTDKYLSRKTISEGFGLYEAAKEVAVPRVPKGRRREESFSRVMAPLLAGFSVPAIIVLATSNKPIDPWRDIGLAFMVMATGLFLASYQLAIGSLYVTFFDGWGKARTLISFLGILFLAVALIVIVAPVIGNWWATLPLLIFLLGSIVPIALRVRASHD